MRIIVTGGAGFIGSHTTDALVQKGHQVMILDNFTSGAKEHIHPRARWRAVDIQDAAKMRALFRRFRPEAVFHFAAHINLRESLKRPRTDFDINVLGSLNVLEASRAAGAKKNIIISSAAVYGENTAVPLKTTERCSPASPYGAAKAAAEQYAEVFSRQWGMRIVILRYANVYGPRQGIRGEGGVVAAFCKQALQNKPLTVFGDGLQTRDFVYIDDVVAANLAALRLSARFGIFNVSTQKETTIRALSAYVLQASGADATIVHMPAAEGDVRRNALDNSGTMRVLKWRPKKAIKEGVRATWKWFDKNGMV